MSMSVEIDGIESFKMVTRPWKHLDRVVLFAAIAIKKAVMEGKAEFSKDYKVRIYETYTHKSNIFLIAVAEDGYVAKPIK